MHYMQEKTKEMDSALTNNMEEYRTQKKAREKRLMAYARRNSEKYAANVICIDCRISGRKKIPEENAAGYSRYYRNITSQYCAF